MGVAGMGILVAEPEGEVTTTGEAADRVTDGEEGRETGRPVEVNPFWSEKARAEAELQAHRPRDLPRVPEGSEEKGHGDQGEWQHPETGSGRSEYWEEVKRSQEDLEKEADVWRETVEKGAGMVVGLRLEARGSRRRSGSPSSPRIEGILRKLMAGGRARAIVAGAPGKGSGRHEKGKESEVP